MPQFGGVKTIFPPQTPSAAIVRPEWIRLPKSGGRCPVSSMSRSALCALILPTKSNGFKPPVLSKSVKGHRLASRGQRLVNVASLLDYIDAQPSGFETQEDRS